MTVMRDLPAGTVTFLFTDIEGSTKLLRELGDAYGNALAEHRRLLREAFALHGGVEVDTQGDAFFYVFARASDAVAAADAGRRAMESGPIRVRMGLHTGEPRVTDEGYVGIDVHKAARIAAAGHGGQILLSEACARLLDRQDLKDLGEHRLKDLSRPERLFQVGEVEFPPLRTLRRTNLPIAATPFLGRERELAEIIGIMRGGDVRLITLTGPGGIGKTRLGLETAAAVAESYPDGVWWVGLATIRDPELVLDEVARAIGSRDGPAETIGDKRLLVLFDNMEHLTAAGPELAVLLARCPNLTIVATSREPLRLSAEHEYRVPALPAAEAVTMFRERAVSWSDDPTVREICRRLDHLPLAIELAAARTRVLSSAQILERLSERLPLLTGGPRDAPERQRTLRATIDWSYGLLTLAEQRLFARLAVFDGGCTLDAAEQVCGADLDTLQSLVEKSLLRHDDERFWMLETIREYAHDRLEEDDDRDTVRRRHASLYLQLARDARAGIDARRGQTEWLDRLDSDHDNLRRAFAWAREIGDLDLQRRLTAALGPFWTARSHLDEGRRWLSEVLAAGPEGVPPAERADALQWAAGLALRQADMIAASAFASEAESISRGLDDPRLLSLALLTSGSVASILSDFVEATARLREAAALAEDLGDDALRAKILHVLGLVALEQGHLQEAQALIEEEMTLIRDDEIWTSNAVTDLAFVTLEQGRLDDARALFSDAVVRSRRLGWKENLQYCLIGAAALASASNEAVRAARLLGAAGALGDEFHVTVQPYTANVRDRAERDLVATLGSDEFRRRVEEGASMPFDEAIDYAIGADQQPVE
jgi:predicted ATPase/class 3 adenylate cyclase